MTLDLETLMERYADGDRRAYEALHAALEPALRASLRRWLRGDDRVDDALQETLIKIHVARGRYRRGAPVIPWAVTIARNVALDRLRGNKRESSLDPEAAAALPAPEPEPPPELAEAEIAEAVRAAIDALPPSLREVVRLHKLEGWSMAEVARELGVKEGAARVRAHRGYRALAAELASFWARRGGNRG